MKLQGTSFDKQYIDMCKKILDEGIMDNDPRPVYEDGKPAHALSIFNYDIVINENQVPVLFSKRLYFKKAIEEILWIWQQRSNHVEDLEAKDNYIWSNWKSYDNGTIGKAYGYQLAKTVDDTGRNQVDNLIYNLKHNPESRRHIVTLWNIQEGHEMALKPCVYETQWVVINNKLNLKVLIRSNDVALGNCFNVIQYWLLHRLICKEVGLDIGKIVFSIAIPHIYDRHIDTIKDQINRFEKLNKIDPVDNKIVNVNIDNESSFNTFTWNDLSIENYDSFGNEPLKSYKYEIAI